MTISYPTFVIRFPEFAALDETQVRQIIEDTLVECNEYLGLSSDVNRQELAQALHTAFNIARNPVLSPSVLNQNGQVVAELSSRNDTIKFGSGQVNSAFTQFYANDYGRRLVNLLNNNLSAVGVYGDYLPY